MLPARDIFSIQASPELIQADALMLIGCNPRTEAPVLNARIRKRVLKGGCIVGVIGERADLTYGLLPHGRWP